MRRFLLSSSLALFLVGSLAMTSADARPWRRGVNYSPAYPAYSSYSYSVPEVVVPPTTYVAPAYTSGSSSYYAPDTYYAPAYRSYYSPSYYYTPGYYRGFYGYGRRGYYGWRR